MAPAAPCAARGDPGGGLEQTPPFSLAPLPDAPGKEFYALSQDVKGYEAAVLAGGLPPRRAGLFPPGDKTLAELGSGGVMKPFTKYLPLKCAAGGDAFALTADGWASGESAAAHGLDLRLFIRPGQEHKKLEAAVRFGDAAKIGTGFDAVGVHGGAIETALDEATAELAKSKLFPMASTYSIEFKIKKPVQTHTTYRIVCAVEKVRAARLATRARAATTQAARAFSLASLLPCPRPKVVHEGRTCLPSSAHPPPSGAGASQGHQVRRLCQDVQWQGALRALHRRDGQRPQDCRRRLRRETTHDRTTRRRDSRHTPSPKAYTFAYV